MSSCANTSFQMVPEAGKRIGNHEIEHRKRGIGERGREALGGEEFAGLCQFHNPAWEATAASLVKSAK